MKRRPQLSRGMRILYRILRWVGGLGFLVSLALLLFTRNLTSLVGFVGVLVFPVVFCVGWIGHITAEESKQNPIAMQGMGGRGG